MLMLLGAGCASAPPEPTAEALAEVAADEQCGRETGRPCFTPFTQAPVLANQESVIRAMSQHYPKRLRAEGIGGTVVLWVFVDERGRQQKVMLRRTSGHPELDRAAVLIARVMRFEPALNRGTRVKVWVEVPLNFTASR